MFPDPQKQEPRATFVLRSSSDGGKAIQIPTRTSSNYWRMRPDLKSALRRKSRIERLGKCVQSCAKSSGGPWTLFPSRCLSTSVGIHPERRLTRPKVVASEVSRFVSRVTLRSLGNTKDPIGRSSASNCIGAATLFRKEIRFKLHPTTPFPIDGANFMKKKHTC